MIRITSACHVIISNKASSFGYVGALSAVSQRAMDRYLCKKRLKEKRSDAGWRTRRLDLKKDTCSSRKNEGHTCGFSLLSKLKNKFIK